MLRAGALALAAALGAHCATEATPPPATPPPAEVQVVEVLQRDVPVYMESIGVTRGDAEIEVRARIEGILQSVNFAEGRIVNKGDLLYTIDPRQYEAALQQAKAKLAQAEADLARYEQDVARFTPLVEQNAVPRQTLDTAVAQVNAGRASVQAAQAAVVTAELDVSYTRIFSPTDGIIGKTGERGKSRRARTVHPAHADLASQSDSPAGEHRRARLPDAGPPARFGTDRRSDGSAEGRDDSR